MKNHIAFKFLAILLCAACFLGALVSGVGILVVTELDLQDKSLDQRYAEDLENDGRQYAQTQLTRYLEYSQPDFPTCVDYSVEGQLYSYNPFPVNTSNYQILDSEGNVLEDKTGAPLTDPVTYTFPAEGTYRKVVSIEPYEEPEREEETVGYTVSINKIPSEGAVEIYGLGLTYAGSSSGMYGQTCIALAWAESDGGILVDFLDDTTELEEMWQSDPLLGITLYDENNDVIYEAHGDDGVGEFFRDQNDELRQFTSFARMEEADETSTRTGIVDSYLNAYSAPDLNSRVLGSLGTGFTVEITQTENVAGVEWGYVPDIGWVRMNQITLVQDAGTGVFAPEYLKPASTEPTQATSAVEETVSPASTEETAAVEETVVPTVAAETLPPETETEATVPAVAAQSVVREADMQGTKVYWDSSAQKTMQLTYTLEPMPEYTLVLYLEKDLSTYYPEHEAVNLLCTHRGSLGKVLALSLVLLAVLVVYLCCAAGRKPGSTEIHPAAFNALPLDLYLLGDIFVGIGLGAIGVLGVEELLEHDWQVCCGLGLGVGYGICLLIVGFCFACAAQFKTPGGYWWRNTLCVRVIHLCWRLCRWLWRKCVKAIPWLGGVIAWCFGLVKKVIRWCFNLVKRLLGWIWRGMERFVALLPLTWQWLMAEAAMFLLMLLGFASHGPAVFLCLAGCVGIILYGARCFGILAESTKRMSKGELDIQVEDPWMLGAFQDFAQDLNGLAGVAMVAAQKQLKSERMKTELITNVSHDIKTPLTSIINYVDLLQKPHTEEEGKQYLEVLDRQSQRLKKLIEDLMEMSKANTGNMTVDIKPLDGEEAVNQALGEFADKLAAAQLVPVFRRPEKPVTMLADGRLLWRVLSNLLSNAVKYALPGTRLYIDLMALEGKVVLSLKNISREELNVEADELMERFVRGDSSRNTEGSGLGLNIAKSLVELQKGSLQLLVDGDLFKVTLIFPEG